ncbi:hypothetical protein TNCV_2304071 [Trichonephila clavipes]|nr:hypothetical protein TNCV_2304071 [Trichonephila clavipes]
MQAQYGDSCLSRRNIYQWIKHFKKGRTLCDDERSESQSTSTTQHNVLVVQGLVIEGMASTSIDNGTTLLNGLLAFKDYAERRVIRSLYRSVVDYISFSPGC